MRTIHFAPDTFSSMGSVNTQVIISFRTFGEAHNYLKVRGLWHVRHHPDAAYYYRTREAMDRDPTGAPAAAYIPAFEDL